MSRAIESHVLCPPGSELVERCPRTGRIYERGHGAFSHAEQTANFVAEAARAADMPKPGDQQCLQTGREYEHGSGARTKTEQTANFLEELSPAAKAQRQADFEKLRDVEARGTA